MKIFGFLINFQISDTLTAQQTRALFFYKIFPIKIRYGKSRQLCFLIGNQLKLIITYGFSAVILLVFVVLLNPFQIPVDFTKLKHDSLSGLHLIGGGR